MFTKSDILAFITLATLATATLMQPRQAGGPIALPKRSSFTKSDGTFDYDKAVTQTVASKNKHRQNLINLPNNTSSLPQGFAIKALASLPSSVEASLKKRQAETLTDEEEDKEWTGKHFSSSTSSKESGSFSIEYGDGSTVPGPVYEDTVAVASIQVANQKFSHVTTLSASFASDPADGILSLAFPAISNLDADPFFVNANSQGAVDSNDLGFYLASSGSELYLGGANSDLYSGSIEYHEISGASIALDGTTAMSDFEVITDSGTTIVYGPPSAVKEFYAQVSGSKLYDSTDGYYSVPCDSAPEVSFSWGGDSFTISADNWMKNVHTVFSFSKTAVGFANLA
ncbi:acid protease [Lentinula lateritia]|nr:acid protease [Lentinula lateritia]